MLSRAVSALMKGCAMSGAIWVGRGAESGFGWGEGGAAGEAELCFALPAGEWLDPSSYLFIQNAISVSPLLGIPRFPLNRRLNSLRFSKKNDWMASGEDNSAINARRLSRLNSPALR